MTVNGVRLRHQLAIRGLTGSRFAEIAAVTPDTVTRALKGRPVSASTVRAFARALATVPELNGAADLLADGVVPTNADGRPGPRCCGLDDLQTIAKLAAPR